MEIVVGTIPHELCIDIYQGKWHVHDRSSNLAAFADTEREALDLLIAVLESAEVLPELLEANHGD